MTTNLKNLEEALAYWQKQYLSATNPYCHVVAQHSGIRVLADNMAVMLAGTCTPRTFSSREGAGEAAVRLDDPVGFDDEPRLVPMHYREFCRLQADRFEMAIHTARVADAWAAQKEPA